MLVVFDLPDGSQGENVFKLGHTVEVLKLSKRIWDTDGGSKHVH